MARFIISHRLQGQENSASPVAAMEEILPSLHAFDIRLDNQVRSQGVRRRIHVDGDALELERLREKWPQDLLVEPELERRPVRSLPGPIERLFEAQGDNPLAAGLGQSLTVVLRGAGKPVIGATATLLVADVTGRGPGSRLTAISDDDGKAAFALNPSLWLPILLLIEPLHTFWDGWQPFPRDGMVVDLPPLPKDGPLGWWHQAVGIAQASRTRGEGIRIGVVDTGVGPHPYLKHVRSLGAVVEGQYDAAPGAGHDVEEHGTHVSGILAARPTQGSGDYGGIAAGAEVLVVRVFPPGGGGANQGDIAEAIDLLSGEHQVDLINLSLGGPQPSQIEQDAIQAAIEAGTLCVAAGGNDGGPLMYPAAYPQAVSVSAVGLLGADPPDSMAAHCAPTQAELFAAGGLYVANFSAFGALTCTAPGVGIISTVPANSAVAAPYAVLSGTSMATPAACAALASLLSEDRVYRGLPRGIGRVQRASAVLASTLTPLGISPIFVGGGVSRAWPV